MVHFKAQKPTPDDALEELRTEDFINFFAQAPSYNDQAFQGEEESDEPDDDLYTPNDHSWFREQLNSNTNQPDKDEYIY